MSFVSPVYFLFVLVVFALYWGIPNRRFQNALILITSYIFYGWWDYRFCSLMLATSLFDYALALAIARSTSPSIRRQLLVLSIVSNIGTLAFFKYFNFFTDSFQSLATSLGVHVSPVELNIILPVGISFYTFQTLSYTIDVYRGQLRASNNLIDYLAFVSFFPQLVAGPIERATNLLPQFERDRQFTYDDAAEGMRQILCGLFKKLVLADGLAQIVDIIYGDPGSFIGPALALATVAFAFQIYFDFSAYSDIARGSARLFGFELMINFNYPYLSASVTEFWRRWHVSLSTWFRDYVYIPLGGNRVGRGRLATNLLITFGLSGLWHGASWNFVIWGLLNGVLLLPAALGVSRSARSVSTSLGLVLHVARVVRTFALICLGWVFFRAATFGDAVLILQRIFTLGDYFRFSMLDQAYKQFIEPPQYFSVWMALLATMVVECVMQRREHPLSISDWPTPVRWAVYSAVLWGAAILMAPERGQFIYFQF